MPKKVKIGIITAVTLVLVFAGYAAYKNWNYKASFVKEVNRNLSAEDRKVYEDRIIAAKKGLEEAQSDEEKFNWTMNLGFNQYGLGSLADARKTFEQAIKLRPEDANAHVALYQVQVDQGDNNGALASIRTAIRIEQENPDIWKKYVQLMIDRFSADNNTVSALYSDAVNKTNSHIDIITSYAAWLEKSGNYQAAKEYWQKAIQKSPANKKLYEAEIKRLDALIKQQNAQ
jgi:tetratricopeptide (TPR) repeat protein